MSLAELKSDKRDRGKSDNEGDFWAFGSHWLLCDAHGEVGKAQVSGRMEFCGKEYVIIADIGGLLRPSSSARAPSYGRICEEVLAILTPRELQVCELIAAGHCDKHVARTLAISGYTVREYVRRSFAKLGISNRTAVLPRLLGINEGPN